MAHTSVKITANANDYRAQMKSAAAQMKELSSEYALTATKAKMTGSAMDELRAKAEFLTQKVGVQKNIVQMNREQQERLTEQLGKQKTKQEELKVKVEAAKKAYEDEKKATGENSDATKELKEALDKVEQEFKDNETVIARTETVLSRQTVSVNRAETALMEMEAELENVNRELKNNKLNEFADACDTAGQKIEQFGKRMTVVSAGLVAFSTASAKMAVDFEDSIAKVSTIMDEGVMSVGEMEDAVIDLSNETGIAAGDIADNVYNAISAGQETADAVNFVRESTKLATAGFAESGDTLDLLTTIMNAYELEAEKVTSVSDMLIQTQNLGKTTVAELSSAMGKVIPTANANGVALDQLCTSYAIMTANGVATAESTTYVNAMLNELGKTGSITDEILRERTGKSFRELMKDGSSLADVLAMIEDSARVQNLTLSDMFSSSEAGKAGLILLGNSAKDFNNVLGQMRESTGATDEAFEKMQTTSYRIKVALNELKNTAMEFGQTIMSSAAPIIEEFTENIHKLCEWFGELDEGQQQTILKVGLFVAAIGPATVGIGKFAQGISSTIKFGQEVASVIPKIVEKIVAKTAATAAGTAADTAGTAATTAHTVATTAATATTGGMTVAQTALNVAMSLCPIIAIVAGITALIVAGVKLYKNWDDIKEKASELGGHIKDKFNGIKESISNAASIADSITKEKLKNIKKAYEENGGGIKGIVAAGWEGIKGYYTAGFEFIDKLTGGKLTEIKNKFLNSGIGQVVSKEFSNVKETISKHMSAATETAKQNLNNMKNAYEENGGGINGIVAAGLEGIKGHYTSGFTYIDKLTDGKLSGIKEKFVTKMSELKESVSEKVEDLQETISEKMKNVGINFSKWDEIKKNVTNTVKETAKTIMDEWNSANTFVATTNSKTKEDADSKWKKIKTSVSKEVKEVRSNITSEFGTSEKKISDTWKRIETDITSRITTAEASVKKEIDYIRGWMNFENLKETVSEIWESIKDKIAEPIEKAREKVENAIEKIQEAFDFDWELPKLKLPHFKITGSFKLDPPSVPKLNVSWYKTGAIMKGPTIFGMNGGRLLGGGEAGEEAILPLGEFYTKLSTMLDRKLESAQNRQEVYVTSYTYIDSEEISCKTVSKVDAKMVQNRRKRR